MVLVPTTGRVQFAIIDELHRIYFKAASPCPSFAHLRRPLAQNETRGLIRGCPQAGSWPTPRPPSELRRFRCAGRPSKCSAMFFLISFRGGRRFSGGRALRLGRGPEGRAASDPNAANPGAPGGRDDLRRKVSQVFEVEAPPEARRRRVTCKSRPLADGSILLACQHSVRLVSIKLAVDAISSFLTWSVSLERGGLWTL